jgi:hypothetical protein
MVIIQKDLLNYLLKTITYKLVNLTIWRITHVYTGTLRHEDIL